MKTLTWQKPGQQNVAQELIKIIINYVAELRVFKNVPRKKYPEKIHQMVYDSVYYLPTHTVPQSEKRYIWNKKFKVYPLYLNSYYYRIDSVEHTVFWDGEIDEIIGRKFKR